MLSQMVFGVRHAVASGEPLHEELVFFLSVAAPRGGQVAGTPRPRRAPTSRCRAHETDDVVMFGAVRAQSVSSAMPPIADTARRSSSRRREVIDIVSAPMPAR